MNEHWPTAPCTLCGQEDRECRMEYAPYAQVFVHRACMHHALRTQSFSKALLDLAREVHMSCGARGRVGWECRRGHLLTPDNVRTRPGTNYRECLTCYRNYTHARDKRPYRNPRLVAAKEDRWTWTHCVNGHEYTPATSIRGRYGERRCRTCLIERSKKGIATRWERYRERQRMEALSPGLKPAAGREMASGPGRDRGQG